MQINKYAEAVERELLLDAIPVDKARLGRAETEARMLAAELESKLSRNEYLVRLICPATNFIAIFDKIGHKGIMDVLNRYGINFSTNNIVQALDLKEDLEKLKIRSDDATIVSFDAVKMYPSITLGMVKTAVEYFCAKKSISNDDKEIVNTCLNMIQFAMCNTLLTFRGKYTMNMAAA